MAYKNLEDIKTYRDNHKEQNKEYQKNYRQSKNGKKRCTIGRWKFNGLIGDYEAIYEMYVNTTHCDCCNIQLITGKTGGSHKVMDHNHKTGEFRNILCHNCNILRFHFDNNYTAYLRMMTL